MRWRPSPSLPPVFRDGAFTANDRSVRAYAFQRRCARWTWEPSAARRSSSSGAGARASRTDAAAPMRPSSAYARPHYLCGIHSRRKYDYRFALEAKPNEAASDIYMPTTGAYLGFISTLDHPEMVGETRRGARAHGGPHRTHAVAQAWEAKLFHIDLTTRCRGATTR